MKLTIDIKRMLLAGILALTMGVAVVGPAAASAINSGGHVISTPAFGDGQETHGGPKRGDGGQETHGGPRRGTPLFGDGQETHGGPR